MRQRIQEILGEIKMTLDQGIAEWAVFAIVVLVGLAAFGLGRLSVANEVRSPISVYMAPQAASPQGMYLGGLIVAAKDGNAYYFPWCSGAEKIGENNRVWFKGEEDARKAGYAPAKNCKGLDGASSR